MNNFLAKSKEEGGDGIITHTDKVVDNIKKLCNKHRITSKETSVLVNSGTLHDIGKLTIGMQKFLTGKAKSKFKYAHNIIGWYFITRYVNLPDVDTVANLVLWHHANLNSCESLAKDLSAIRNVLTDVDIDRMKKMCEHYNIPTFEEESERDFEDNQFYRVDNLLRTILVTSDVCASTNEDILNLSRHEIQPLSSLKKSFSETDRTKSQLSIVDSIISGTTNSINAPTALGKSIITLLFAMQSDEATLWVCPTNVIALSIYNDVIKALDMMGLDMTVELYLTGGKTKKSNSGLREFESKLIITNIDSFTKPTITNSFGSKCMMIYESNVVFDESHEYDKMDCALNASYNSIMNFRHNSIGSTTVLLTATPSPPRFLMVGGKQINYLPEQGKYFKAFHDKKYFLNFHDTVPLDLMVGEFIYYGHVIDDVQRMYLNHQESKLISHGRYLDDDKEKKKNMVIDNFTKDGPRLNFCVFTNQILSTGCDYSVGLMFIKCPTIRELYQSLGRINRYGKNESSQVHIILGKSKSESKHIGNADDNILQEKFMAELRSKFEGKGATMDELYNFLSYFEDKHRVLINNISKDNLQTSREMLKRIFPKKYIDKNKNAKVTANGNKIRQSPVADGIYVCAKRKDSDEYITMNYNVNRNIGLTNTFKEDSNTYKNQIKVIKTWADYNKHKKITPENMIKNSIFFDTPYVVFSHKYCDDIGLYDEVELGI